LGVGIAYADVSTGEFAATQITEGDIAGQLQQEVARLGARECLLPQTIAEAGSLPLGIEETYITPFPDWRVAAASSALGLCRAAWPPAGDRRGGRGAGLSPGNSARVTEPPDAADELYDRRLHGARCGHATQP